MAVAFQNRTEAGKQLATQLLQYAGRPDVIVLGLPRGGVLVGYEVAHALHVPLDVFIVRKLVGTSDGERPVIGALASGGVRVLDERLIRSLQLSRIEVSRATSDTHRELDRRECAFRGMRPTPDVRGRTVILVDDGVRGSAAMFPAIAALRQLRAATIVAATPVASVAAHGELKRLADRCVCLATPDALESVKACYADDPQPTDVQVRALLDTSAREMGADRPRLPRAPRREVHAAVASYGVRAPSFAYGFSRLDAGAGGAILSSGARVAE